MIRILSGRESDEVGEHKECVLINLKSFVSFMVHKVRFPGLLVARDPLSPDQSMEQGLGKINIILGT